VNAALWPAPASQDWIDTFRAGSCTTKTRNRRLRMVGYSAIAASHACPPSTGLIRLSNSCYKCRARLSPLVVSVGSPMPQSTAFTYDDPMQYQAAVRGGEVEVSVTARGKFRGSLIKIDLCNLWMQSGWENLPRVIRASLGQKRTGIQFLADAGQPVLQHTGQELHTKAIAAFQPGAAFHVRSQSPCRWATISLTSETFCAQSNALAGRDLRAGSNIRFMHPKAAHMTRLVFLHTSARQLAVAAPDVIAHPEVASALEHHLVHAMMTCLADGEPTTAGSGWRQHTAIINRFEEVVAKNCDRPLYLAEICAAVGVNERTLRACCEEHLGMGPIRYLWIRRMHLTRRALLRADRSKATVTQIATDHGFWELGRFSVSYQALFGESPSASLRKPPDHLIATKSRRPLSLADSDFA
jgi:AraC-like DNA-binding protein